MSNSWGYDTDCFGFGTVPVLDAAFDYAETVGRGGLGAVTVFSAGNGGCDFSGDGMHAHHAVVSVGALSGQDRRVGYSSYGDLLDIMAPTNIPTTDVQGEGGYGTLDGDPDYVPTYGGTSAAAPVVSGVFALMFEANPRLTAAQARDVICRTATRTRGDEAEYDETGWSPTYGCGRVDAAAAVAAVADAPPPAPVVLAPGTWAYEGQVRLAWEPVEDPDGEPVRYEVRHWATSSPGAVQTTWVDVPFLDLSDRTTLGDVISWQVEAHDAWGAGPASQVTGFEVVAFPEPQGGCTTTRIPALGLAVFGVLVGLIRRRRS